ncbi:MAG: hypothetical protein DMF45_11705 [Verrucomicrobia bacterium]|nr:MAG: hypothetical protein DMF45_11705 [Verrucomicrobiota bacterium]
MRSIWKRIRYRLEWVGLLMAAKLVPLLSRKSCYRFALALGGLMSILDRHGRKVALSNLEVAFGDRFSQREREQIPLRQFRMVKPGLRFSRLERHDHFAGVQKRTARSYFQKIARAIGPRIDSAARRNRSSL